MSRLKHIATRPSRVAGLHVTITADGLHCAVAVCKLAGATAALETFEPNVTPAEVLELVAPWTPVHVVVAGQGVARRDLNGQRTATESEVIRALMPHGNPDEVLLEFVSQDAGVSAALLRKARWEEVHAEFDAHFKALQMVTFGLEAEAVGAQACTSSESGWELDGNPLGDHGHIAVGAALLLAAEPNRTTDDRAQAAQDRRFRTLTIRLGAVGVFLLFAAATANVLCYQHYQKKHAELSAEAQTHQALIQEVTTLQAEVDTKKELIQQTGLSNAGKLTEMSDRIGQTVPGEITLNALVLAPLEGKLKPGKSIQFGHGVLRAEGFAADADVLSGWMASIRALEQVESVELNNYDRGGRNPGVFTLEIHWTT